MRLLFGIALLLQCLVNIDGFSLIRSSNNARGMDDTKSDLFNRLTNYETTTISHHQLHSIDDYDTPVYPTNGILQFDAFGRVKLFL